MKDFGGWRAINNVVLFIKVNINVLQLEQEQQSKKAESKFMQDN
jgi:hypothetical protein